MTAPDLDRLADIDKIVEPILKATRVPGAAVAIVSDRECLFARGYGVRDLATREPVTPHTAFAIGSTTKAINGTLLGMLAECGTIDWDAPVQRYLPRFRLGDAARSAEISIRDLCLMRTGLPRHDWLWIANPFDRAELVARLAHLELSVGLRERLEYNNLTVTLAGHIAETVTGKSWETLVQDAILTPLGMDETSVTRPDEGDVSRAYRERLDHQLIEAEWMPGDHTAPSGGAIYSTARDMGRWMSANLRTEEDGGSSPISLPVLREAHRPQIIVGENRLPGATSGAGYGLGWMIDRYNGHATISHGGFQHDMSSEVALFPEHKLGIVCLTNFGLGTAARPICLHIFDMLCGNEPLQPLATKLALYQERVEARHASLAARPRHDAAVPSHRPHDYHGRYSHPGYGDVEILGSEGWNLVLKRPALSIELMHWHFDSWMPCDPARFGLQVPHPFDGSSPILFETDGDGHVAALSINFEPSVAPIQFRKIN